MNEADRPFSMNGLPWTSAAIAEAGSQIRHGGHIGFTFGFEALEHLFELDRQVFSRRPDLGLQVWTVADKKSYSDEELQALASLRHVRKLEISLAQARVISPLMQLDLEALTLKGGKSVSLDFLPSLKNLSTLELYGDFSRLEALADCHSLQSLYAGGSRIAADELLDSLPDLSALTLDGCTAPENLAVLNRRGLKALFLSSLRKLGTLDDLADFSGLEVLKIHGAPHLQKLPSLANMAALKHLELKRLKIWDNPEVLQSLPSLETLVLEEINTHLQAERFSFLPTRPCLSRIDFRTIDWGKRRRAQLEAIFLAAGKTHLIEPDPEAAGE